LTREKKDRIIPQPFLIDLRTIRIALRTIKPAREIDIMPKKELFEKRQPETVYSSELNAEIGVTIRANRLSKSEMLGELMAWRAAWYVLTGKDMHIDDESAVPYAKLLNVKNSLTAWASAAMRRRCI